MASPEIEALSQALARLPGLGPRSARRAVLHLMKKREAALQPLLAALKNVADKLSTCSICGNVDTSDPCSICRDPRRDEKMLCVVEEVADLWALDRSRLFPGRYHVLGGRLSALDGVRPEDLTIDQLVGRVSKGGNRRGRARHECDFGGSDHRPLSSPSAWKDFQSGSASWRTVFRSVASSTISTRERSPRRCARAGRFLEPPDLKD